MCGIVSKSVLPEEQGGSEIRKVGATVDTSSGITLNHATLQHAVTSLDIGMLKKVTIPLLFFIGMLVSFTAKAEEKPNILFLFADDMCFEIIREFGHTDIDTPNLDKLVQRGTTFTHAYNMGSWSGAVCVASRHMINTGAFVWKAEETYNQFGGGNKKKKGEAPPKSAKNLAEQGLMWSQMMEKAGYDTYFTGKWHVKAKAEDIYQTAKNVRGGMPKQTTEGYNRPIEGQPDTWSPYDPKFGGFWEGGKHWSEVVKDDALEFLNTAKNKDKPFFMTLAFNAVHDPRQAPKGFIDRYPLDRIKLPTNFMPEYPYKDAIDCGKGLRDEKLAPFPRTEYSVKVNRQEYYAICEHMDEQVGLILDALEATGKANNTWIFFTADHGLSVGHHGLLGKQNLFDHSIRVPFIVAGPGVEKGKKHAAKVYLQDVMPTAMELAGAPIPDHVQFKSILPLLDGSAKKSYDAIYGGYLKGQRCVVKGDHKLMLFPRVPLIQLFNTKDDPDEMINVYDDNKDLAKSLFQDFLKLQEETGDKLDVKSVFPELL